ncbi:MAG: helix-turn-helix domain-containing protein [bacterium]
MKNSIKNCSFEIENLFQQITGSYYLMPNLKKCLNKILEIINSELSIFASFIYYKQQNDEMLVVSNYLDEDKKSFNFKISEISETLFKENYPNLASNKRINIDPELEACLIPIHFEVNPLGMMIFFANSNSLSAENIIEDSIGAYVTAACLGNNLITSKENILNNCFGIKVNNEISVKKLLEWRMQEIISRFSSQLLPEQNIYHEISRETEKIVIMTALKEFDHNQSKTAKCLGINRNTLRKKIKDLSIV